MQHDEVKTKIFTFEPIQYGVPREYKVCLLLNVILNIMSFLISLGYMAGY